MEYYEYIVNFGFNHQTLTSLISGRKGSEDGLLTNRLERRGLRRGRERVPTGACLTWRETYQKSPRGPAHRCPQRLAVRLRVRGGEGAGERPQQMAGDRAVRTHRRLAPAERVERCRSRSRPREKGPPLRFEQRDSHVGASGQSLVTSLGAGRGPRVEGGGRVGHWCGQDGTRRLDLQHGHVARRLDVVEPVGRHGGGVGRGDVAQVGVREDPRSPVSAAAPEPTRRNQ
jgi:hypothetical protein